MARQVIQQSVISDGARVVFHGERKIPDSGFSTVADAIRYAETYKDRYEMIEAFGVNAIEVVWHGHIIETYMIKR